MFEASLESDLRTAVDIGPPEWNLPPELSQSHDQQLAPIVAQMIDSGMLEFSNAHKLVPTVVWQPRYEGKPYAIATPEGLREFLGGESRVSWNYHEVDFDGTEVETGVLTFESGQDVDGGGSTSRKVTLTFRGKDREFHGFTLTLKDATASGERLLREVQVSAAGRVIDQRELVRTTGEAVTLYAYDERWHLQPEPDYRLKKTTPPEKGIVKTSHVREKTQVVYGIGDLSQPSERDDLLRGASVRVDRYPVDSPHLTVSHQERDGLAQTSEKPEPKPRDVKFTSRVGHLFGRNGQQPPPVQQLAYDLAQISMMMPPEPELFALVKTKLPPPK